MEMFSLQLASSKDRSAQCMDEEKQFIDVKQTYIFSASVPNLCGVITYLVKNLQQ